MAEEGRPLWPVAKNTLAHGHACLAGGQCQDEWWGSVPDTSLPVDKLHRGTLACMCAHDVWHETRDNTHLHLAGLI